MGEVPGEVLRWFIGEEPLREFPERGQVVGAEEVGEGLGNLPGRVDLALQQPVAQLPGRGVDELDLVGPADDPVGDALTDPHLDDLFHGVRDGRQVLDVDGRDDVNAGVEQVEHVLPALGVPAQARHIGVGQFVDQCHARAPRQHAFQVHLLESGTVVLADAPGDDLQTRGASSGQRPVVVLDHRNDNVGARCPPALSFVEHGDGLARSGGSRQVDAEMA